MNSILNKVKKFCNIGSDYNVFDEDIIMLINSNFRTLNQLGVGVKGFCIDGASETWFDFLEENTDELSSVVEFVCLNVRLIFDPPVGSTLTAYKERIQELTWRLNVQVDPKVGNAL